MIPNIHIGFVEHIQCVREWSWTSDDNGCKGYHIWCVEQGGAQVRTLGQEYHLLPGDIFLFNFNQNHFCTHNPENPLCVTTVYFQCEVNDMSSRAFHQQKLLADSLRHGMEWERKGNHEMSLLWIHSVICEMFHEQKLTRNIPTQVQNACELIDQAFPNTLPLNDLARKVGYSPNQLIRLFRKSIDVTPVQYEIRKKIEYAKGMLLYGNTPISEISVKVGYNDVAYFSKLFKKYTGYSPAAYRRIVHEKQL